MEFLIWPTEAGEENQGPRVDLEAATEIDGGYVGVPGGPGSLDVLLFWLPDEPEVSPDMESAMVVCLQ